MNKNKIFGVFATGLTFIACSISYMLTRQILLACIWGIAGLIPIIFVVGKKYMKLCPDQQIAFFATIIAFLSAVFAGFTWYSSNRSLELYRTALESQYSPHIYPIIQSLKDANDPQLLIFNFGEPTEIVDYKIIFKNADSKVPKFKPISEDELGEGFKIRGKKLPKQTSVLYFRDKNYAQFLYDYLKDNEDVIYCDGYIAVKNKMSSKIETFNIKCKRSLNKSTQEVYWHPDPGPYY